MNRKVGRKGKRGDSSRSLWAILAGLFASNSPLSWCNIISFLFAHCKVYVHSLLNWEVEVFDFGRGDWIYDIKHDSVPQR